MHISWLVSGINGEELISDESISNIGIGGHITERY